MKKVLGFLPEGKRRMKAASSKTRNNYRGAIGTLFYFAEFRRYVPKGVVDIESVAVAKEKGGDIELFSAGGADANPGGR